MISPQTTAEARKDIRQRILKQRNTLSAEERRRKSAAIINSLLLLQEIIHSETLFIYVNFRSEVETLPLIRKALTLGKTVCVPLTETKNSQLLAYKITDPELDLRPGYCGIPEPDPRGLDPVAPQSIDTVILPGSVFDRQGGRLGYGGGFYDRFLANQAPEALRIGVGYELQVVSTLPLLSHDQPLHYLATEKTILHF